MQRTIQHILSLDSIKLKSALNLDLDTARIELQCLLQQVLGVTRAYLFAHPERVLNETENDSFQTFFLRRLNGEPIAYILGFREFFGLKFFVTPDTLIPRPDTELLVELVLARIDADRPLPVEQGDICNEKQFNILELGTGSGAIALMIAHQRRGVKVLACDRSEAALEVARKNAHQLGITHVDFILSDWFSALGEQYFNLIVSNPPYITSNDGHLLQGDVRFEPVSALVSGSDGLDDIRRIVVGAKFHLQSRGWLLLEHGYEQSKQVRNLLAEAGFKEIFSAQDLSGIERCSGGQFIAL